MAVLKIESVIVIFWQKFNNPQSKSCLYTTVFSLRLESKILYRHFLSFFPFLTYPFDSPKEGNSRTFNIYLSITFIVEDYASSEIAARGIKYQSAAVPGHPCSIGLPLYIGIELLALWYYLYCFSLWGFYTYILTVISSDLYSLFLLIHFFLRILSVVYLPTVMVINQQSLFHFNPTWC